MKSVVKVVLLAAMSGMLCSFSGLATPIDISLTGASAPVHLWGDGSDIFGEDFQFEDVVTAPVGGYPAINLAGANSIQVTWNAPAGYMYVVNPPPANFKNDSLEFSIWVQFGQAGQASSLGSVTSESVSMNMVYGNPALSGGVQLENSPRLAGFFPAITAYENVEMSPGTSAFAFTSATVDATFSLTGLSELLNPNDDGESPAQFFAVLWGVPTIYTLPPQFYHGPPDPGQLFTLEPLPVQGTVPDVTSTVILAGMSFLGLMLCGRKFGVKEATD